MLDLTPEGLRTVDDLAQRHGVSSDAVATLLRALMQGNGTQAQFNHPDLGGMGQWSQGGMIMVGDMFNQTLKHRVDALCRELAEILRTQPVLAAGPAQSQSQNQTGGFSGVSLFVPGSGSSGAWWPAELGNPTSNGAQNDLRYAYFPGARRLAILQGGRVSLHDTGEHRIAGFSQQQSGDQSLTFTSQLGLVRVADLPVFAPAGPGPSAPSAAPSTRVEGQTTGPETPAEPAPVQASSSADDIITKIERLHDLRKRDILTEDEFAAKKAELLSRL